MSSNGQSIEQQMREVRREVLEDAEQLRESTRELKDWRQYVRSFPLAALAGAIAAGYYLAPAIRSTPSRSTESPDSELSQGTESGEEELPSTTSVALGAVTGFAGRLAAKYAMNWAQTQLFGGAGSSAGESSGKKENAE